MKDCKKQKTFVRLPAKQKVGTPNVVKLESWGCIIINYASIPNNWKGL